MVPLDNPHVLKTERNFICPTWSICWGHYKQPLVTRTSTQRTPNNLIRTLQLLCPRRQRNTDMARGSNGCREVAQQHLEPPGQVPPKRLLSKLP